MKTVKDNPDANHWNIEYGYDFNANESKLYPFRVFATSENGWFDMYKFHLFTTENAAHEFCDGVTRGFEIAFHLPDEFPQRILEFTQLPPQRDINIKIKPDVITTSHGLRIYSPQLRGCFFKNERKLRYFKSYSKLAG